MFFSELKWFFYGITMKNLWSTFIFKSVRDEEEKNCWIKLLFLFSLHTNSILKAL